VSAQASDVVMKTEAAGPMSQDSVVRLRGVRKTFGSKVAVDGLTLRITRGEVFGLIGPNGAGKTTTFSMLAGFLRPTEGAVEVLGYDPQHVDALRGRLGVLPQDAILPPNDTVGDLLVHLARLQGMGPQRALDDAKTVLGEVDGSSWWGLKCSALSHGMAKRVGIAQAFLGTPEIVLLDEPTAGLDPKIAYEVRQIIKARKGRCTLVISSHNMHELEEMCDSAAILDHGKLVSAGTMAELTASSQEVRIILAEGPRPIDAVRALPIAKRVDFDEASGELVVYFERSGVDAERVIGEVLWVLLNAQARISGVTKGRGLEQTVMDLTA
jgi:ABC-2 type transport system ATP-binding protein